MTRAIDITGKKWNRLTAVRRDRSRHSHWFFRCDCGIEKSQYAPNVKRGDIKSCGCLNFETLDARNRTHGLSAHPLYSLWGGMKSRCQKHPDYAGRGITVCERWLNFANFLEDMAPRPDGTTLDRIDVNGNYEKANCRWATRREQAENTTRNVYLEYDGIRLTISQWARRLGVNQKTLQRRYSAGWVACDIITTPIGARRDISGS